MLRIAVYRIGRCFKMACGSSLEPYSTSSVSTDESTSDSEPENQATFNDIDILREQVLSTISTKLYGGVPYLQLSNNAQKKLLQLNVKRELRKRKRKEHGSRETESERETVETVKKEFREDWTPKKLLKVQQRERLKEALSNGLRVAIDCSMSELMSPKEICRLGRQVNLVYKTIKSAEKPFHLYLTGLVKDSSVHQECQRQCPGFDNYIIDTSPSLHHQLFTHDELVYLTPDSPYVLESLDDKKVYVLGGLVDESLVVDHTYKKALELKLQTARLPIDVYMDNSLPGRHCCLPINQVVAILLDIQSGEDWGTALERHIPRRKGYVLKPK